jgi:hypothetical protein
MRTWPPKKGTYFPAPKSLREIATVANAEIDMRRWGESHKVANKYLGMSRFLYRIG